MVIKYIGIKKAHKIQNNIPVCKYAEVKTFNGIVFFESEAKPLRFKVEVVLICHCSSFVLFEPFCICDDGSINLSLFPSFVEAFSKSFIK